MVTVYPLKEVVEYGPFIHPLVSKDRFVFAMPVRFVLPGYDFQPLAAKLWRTGHDFVEAMEGYVFDGPSGAFNTPTSIVPSALHDIACTRTTHGYPLSGYFSRQRLYREAAAAQHMAACRRWAHWTALVVGNVWYDDVKRLRRQPKEEVIVLREQEDR